MVVAALSLWFALAAGARSSLSRTKQPRATRGFKNTEMMTARGFGKRGLVLHGQESVNGETKSGFRKILYIQIFEIFLQFE